MNKISMLFLGCLFVMNLFPAHKSGLVLQKVGPFALREICLKKLAFNKIDRFNKDEVAYPNREYAHSETTRKSQENQICEIEELLRERALLEAVRDTYFFQQGAEMGCLHISLKEVYNSCYRRSLPELSDSRPFGRCYLSDEEFESKFKALRDLYEKDLYLMERQKDRLFAKLTVQKAKMLLSSFDRKKE